MWKGGSLLKLCHVIFSRGRGVTSYIWHSTDVRAEYPLFQCCQVYDWPPFFDKKYMTDPIFLDWHMKGPTFSDIPVYAHIFHSEIFKAACSLGIQ